MVSETATEPTHTLTCRLQKEPKGHAYDPLTGILLYQYGYTSGYLTSVTDANGRMTQIVRDASNRPTAIISPSGRETKLLVNSAGYLEQITPRT